jgi:hypothetical protein
MIENLQPYRGIEWTRSLRTISNPDKHRRLTAIKHDGRLLGVRRRYSSAGRFSTQPKVGAAGQLTVDRYDVEFDAHETFAIEPSGLVLMPTLREIQLGVAQTIATFRLEF